MQTAYTYCKSILTHGKNGKNARRGYLFLYNGKEIDNEGLGGGGSTYDYGFRIYNPQIARFLSVDPLTSSYPWYTPYQFAGNRPIIAIDLDGLEEYYVTRWVDQKGAHQSSEISVYVAGQHAGGQLINRQIPANTSDAGAVLIYRQLGTNELIDTKFGELNETESKAPLSKVRGYAPEDNHPLGINESTTYNNWSEWKGNVAMPPPPDAGRPFAKGTAITRYKYEGLDLSNGSIYTGYKANPRSYVKNIIKDLAATPGVSSINIRYDVFSQDVNGSKIPGSGGMPSVYEAAEIATGQMKSLFDKELKKAGLDIKVTTNKPVETQNLEQGGFKIIPK